MISVTVFQIVYWFLYSDFFFYRLNNNIFLNRLWLYSLVYIYLIV